MKSKPCGCVKYVDLYDKKAQTLERNLGQTSHCDDADDGFNKDYVLLGGLKRKSGKKNNLVHTM